MGFLKSIFGKSGKINSSPTQKANEHKITIEDIQNIIRTYGQFLETHAPTPGCVADAKKLPFLKDTIKTALITGMRATDDPSMVQMLKVAYFQLANFQDGVGDKDKGLDVLNMDNKMDIQELAKVVLDQSAGMDEWNEKVEKELKILHAELAHFGL